MNTKTIETSKSAFVDVVRKTATAVALGVAVSGCSFFSSEVPSYSDQQFAAMHMVQKNVNLQSGKTVYSVEFPGDIGCGGGMAAVKASMPKRGNAEEGVKKTFTVYESFSESATSCTNVKFGFELLRDGKIKETVPGY